MRASRLVSILLLLQARGQLTAAAIAQELGVSLRTIYRDLDALGAAGVPVYADHGPLGGYRLVDGYRTRLTGLNADEAEALFLSGSEGPAAQLGLETVLAAAQLKVLAALPPELRSRASRIRERFHLVAPRWFSTPEEVPHLATVAQAVWEARPLEMRYRRSEGTVERTIEPLGLVLKAGVWYLVARRGRELRTYRVSRVVAARPLEERFERPDDFDLPAWWETSAAEFEQSLATTWVRVRVADDALGDLAYAVGGSRRLGTAEREAGGGADGWLELDLWSDSLDTVHDDLLRLGPRVEVLEPFELRERMARTTAATARLYERAGAQGPAPVPGAPAAGSAIVRA